MIEYLDSIAIFGLTLAVAIVGGIMLHNSPENRAKREQSKQDHKHSSR